MCTLTGLVMGDLKSGIIIGAMMELAFIGAFSVGASLPPDMISGGVLGAALTLAAGNDPEVALTIGVPIASLALLMKNACKIFILPIFVHKADDYAVKGNSKGVARMHMLGGFLYLNLPYGIFVFSAFLLGNTVIQSVLDAIPQFIKIRTYNCNWLDAGSRICSSCKHDNNKRIGISYYWDFSFLHTWECQ